MIASFVPNSYLEELEKKIERIQVYRQELLKKSNKKMDDMVNTSHLIKDMFIAGFAIGIILFTRRSFKKH